MNEAQDADKPKRHRSPNYPYIDLEEALNKARSIHNAGGIHPVGFGAAMSAWNYKHGSTNSAIAALKGFGLVDVTGEGDKRKIQVTETARKILANHSERAELLKKAALSPTLYKELWDKFDGVLPNSDKVIDEYLEFEKLFNPKVISGIIKDFRTTVAFAKLSTSDIIESDGDDSGTDDAPPSDDNPPTGTGGKGGSGKVSQPVLRKGVMFNITIDVLEDGQINVTNGGTLTSETFGILTDVFELKKKHEVVVPQRSVADDKVDSNDGGHDGEGI